VNVKGQYSWNTAYRKKCSLLSFMSVTSSATAVSPLPGQRCRTVCLNSFSNRTSPSDNLNDRLKRLCLVSRAAAPCGYTFRAPTRNFLNYLLTYLVARRWQFCQSGGQRTDTHTVWSNCRSAKLSISFLLINDPKYLRAKPNACNI